MSEQRRRKVVPDRAKQPSKNVRGLRITDPETARVVAIYDTADRVVGAGCLISSTHILTCLHVLEDATDMNVQEAIFKVWLIGVKGQPHARTRLVNAGTIDTPAMDLALLKIDDDLNLSIPTVEFAAPLRHSGKSFSVFGFPGEDPQGRNVRGFLHAANAEGLVQMDGFSSLDVEGGFSGAPVWLDEVKSFVGLVVTEISDVKISWCIPSQVLCRFYNDLHVRFRVPPSDRPEIHDYFEDDPNVQLFGNISNDGLRRLTATVTKGKDDEGDDCYVATLTYECLDSKPRGAFVTFITFPDFREEDEDAYELFARLGPDNKASVEFYPGEAFTVAAIGDAGETSLTVDLSKVEKRPKGFV